MPKDQVQTPGEPQGADETPNLPVVPPTALADYKALLDAVKGQDNEAASDQIVEKILSAATAADVFQRDNLLHAEDIAGRPHTVLRVRAQASDFEDGDGAYAVVEAVFDGGEPFMYTCGARNVMAQLFRLDQLGALPIRVQVDVSTKATRAGFHVMWLTPAPAEENF